MPTTQHQIFFHNHMFDPFYPLLPTPQSPFPLATTLLLSVSVSLSLLVKPRSLHILLSTGQNPKSYKVLPSLSAPAYQLLLFCFLL